jgi:transcriptional regulator with XRE-family HTH domain
MADHTAENLRRIMAEQGLMVKDVTKRTGLDRRTVLGILEGKSKPQPRTLHRLAKGLGVAHDEFFLDPTRLLYRRFDYQTNPVIDDVARAHPELFSDWTAADFDELHSRFGAGGPLTVEGAVSAVRQMNRKRELHHKLDLLLETSQAELIEALLETAYQKTVVLRPNSE